MAGVGPPRAGPDNRASPLFHTSVFVLEAAQKLLKTTVESS